MFVLFQWVWHQMMCVSAEQMPASIWCELMCVCLMWIHVHIPAKRKCVGVDSVLGSAYLASSQNLFFLSVYVFLYLGCFPKLYWFWGFVLELLPDSCLFFLCCVLIIYVRKPCLISWWNLSSPDAAVLIE